MKKLILAIACIALVLVSCTPKEEEQKKVKTVEVDPSSITLTVGDNIALKVKVKPEDAEYLSVEWSSDDESVAQINRAGTLKAVAPGSATVTATIDGVKGSCSVTVVENATPVSGIKVTPSSVTLGKGATETITATVEPADAANKNVAWSTSDAKVATVDGGVVTGVGGGECDIVAKTADGGFEAVCHVIVNHIPVESIAFSNGSPYTIVADNDGTYSLFVTFSPANTSDRDITWEVSEKSLATVASTGEGQAEVSFNSMAIGPVTVTATVSGTNCSASQQFFLVGSQELVFMPQGKIVVGRRGLWQFNIWQYSGAADLKWETGSSTFSGNSAEFAPQQSGENTVIVSGNYDDVPFKVLLTYQAEEWFINQAIDGANARNTYPVFNKECTRAYFVTRGARRLYEINLEEGTLNLFYDLNDGKNDNGGDICVNPVSGDIYCSNQQHIYCISPEGQQRWEIPVPTGTQATSIAGGGPALSNDCSVVFIPTVDKRLLAVTAATGTILDEYAIEPYHTQIAVYGNDKLVVSSTVHNASSSICFLSFSGGKFTEEKVIEHPSKDPADISSPIVNSSQTKCWFPCNGGVLVEVDLTSKTAVAAKVTGNNGHVWSPCLTADGRWMFFASQDKAMVNRIDPSSFSESTVMETLYDNGNDNYLNFTHVACDTDGNVYFFIKEDGAGNNAFYRLNAARGWQPEVLSSIEKQNNDPQAFFNFGGGFLIGGGGQNVNNRVLVRCVDAERAKSWSGAGGDVCATKNANLVYGE